MEIEFKEDEQFEVVKHLERWRDLTNNKDFKKESRFVGMTIEEYYREIDLDIPKDMLHLKDKIITSYSIKLNTDPNAGPIGVSVDFKYGN